MTTSSNDNLISEVVKQLVEKEQDLVKSLLQSSLQEMLEAQMDETIGVAKSKRSETRQSYRSGYYPRTLLTRVGRIQLRVPRGSQNISTYNSKFLFPEYGFRTKTIGSGHPQVI